jgi:hypothetical protein
MDNSLLSLIDSAASILVVLPTKPYFDQVAAGLALYLSIHDRKDVSIYCPSPMTVGFNRLIGVNRISEELAKKNLMIRFVGYPSDSIDKVGYDIESGEFKLTVTPKAGLTAPQKNQIVTDYSGTTADLLILVGGANDSHFPILSTPDSANAKIAHIGTRALDSKKEVLSFARPASTTSELAAGLIKENGLVLDPDIASNLVMGIEEGTSNFASPEVNPETFEIFADLLRNGGQRLPRVKLSPASFPAGAIPGRPFGAPVLKRPVTPVQQIETQAETLTSEKGEEAAEVNPPSDWLQPKIYKGTSVR